jgi:hypothetical protein
MLDDLANHDHGIETVDIPFVDVDEGSLDDINVHTPTKPVFGDINVAVPSFEGQPVVAPIFDFDIGEVPPWTVTPPIFYFPEVPDVTWPVLTATLPAEIDVTGMIPTAPSVTLPPVPSIDDVFIPSAPPLNIPQFDYGPLPVLDVTPPDAMFVWNEAEYDSDLMQAMRNKLLYDVQNPGTGIDPEVEQAIWDRAISRQMTENEKSYNEALNYWAARGFELPPGSLVSALCEIRHKIDGTMEDLNNDILIQQSKLAQEYAKIAISQAIDYEKMVMDYINRRNQRLFEAAKYTVEAALLIYQAQIECYKAQLEAYKIYTEVFKAQIEAELAKMEIYKAQIEAAKLTVEIQELYIEAYKAQLQGILTTVEIYKTQMEAVSIVTEVNKSRVETYKTQVDAYVAEISAVTARYNAYQAQLAGEATKADVYEAESKAYVAQIEGYKARGELEVMEGEVLVQANKSEVETFKGYVDKYKADVDRMIAEAEVIAKQQGYETALYDAEIRQYSADVDGLAKLYLGRVEEAKALWDSQIKQAEVNLRAQISQYEFDTDTIKTLAQVYAQLGAAAISMVSASTHLGYQQSRSDSTSQNASAANSSSTQSFGDRTAGVQRTSYAEEHIYHHSA